MIEHTGTSGIHHITAVAGDPQANLDFYAGVLGLRFVKKTVNFDDPGTYHLYYGDETGSPGTILTFFPWGPRVGRGEPGVGQAVTVAFSVPPGSLRFWQERLAALSVEVAGPTQQFGERRIEMADPDGLTVALVEDASDGARRPGAPTAQIPDGAAVRGFHSVLLAEEGYEQTAALLTGPLGFRSIGTEDNRMRFQAGNAGGVVDITVSPTAPRGRMGTGSVHHVAYRTPDDPSQVAMRAELLKAGANVTPVIDRQYFHSIYFREPGGVLFEVATDPPGFAVDEAPEELGSALKLPPQYESQRSVIEQILPPISVPEPFAPEGVS